MIPVFDSNILIDLLASIPQATEEYKRYPRRIISIISWIEVLSGIRDDRVQATKEFLQGNFIVLPLDDEITEFSCVIRRQRRIKLPDAIIWATAMQQNTLLVTRNSKDFPKGDPTIRIPYVLKKH